MTEYLPQLPDLPDLEASLSSALKASGRTVQGLVILNRAPFSDASSFPAEVITCRVDDETEIHLFIKYGIGHVESGFGHRGGVPYECRVYDALRSRSVLRFLPFVGCFVDEASGISCLVLEFLECGARFTKTKDADQWLVASAAWIGGFHAAMDGAHLPARHADLYKYDFKYYAGWSERAATLTSAINGRFPWLKQLCQDFRQVIPLLVEAPCTLIHGEFYPANILVEHGVVIPVDWESAALAAGEIDLACLTDGGWSPELVADCIRVYCEARWSGMTPLGFEQRLAAARLYMGFRWLGERPDFVEPFVRGGGVTQMLTQAEVLGLV